jgi:hypothetical protein
MNLFNLFATLTLDNSEYEKKINESGKSAASVSSKMGTAFKTAGRVIGGVVTGVAAVTTAIAALAVKTVDYMGDIDDNAQRVGMSTEAYQKWAYAMQLAGGDASTLQIVMRELTTFTNELSAGQGDALLTLQKLGIGYEDFMAMPVDQQLQAIIEGLQGMESQTDKTTIAQEIFGNRAYQQLMPILNQEKGYVDDLFESMEDLGLVIGDDVVKAGAALGDKLDQLKLTFKTVGASIMSDLFPQIELVIEGLTGMATGAEGAGDKFVEGIIGIVDKLVSALPNLIEIAGNLLVEVLGGIISALPSMVPNIIEVLEALLFKVIDILPSLTQSIADLAVALVDALLKVDWGSLLINLFEALIEIAFVQLPNMLLDALISIFDTVINLFTTKDGLKSLAEFGKNIGEALINGLIAVVESGINLAVKALNAITSGISKIWTWTGADPIPPIPNVSLPRVDFAEGGMMDDLDLGTYYLARAGEDGAEIVARGSRGTGVANVEQIADAQYMAMQDYDLRGAIQNAAVAIVNGIVTGLGNQDNNTEITVRIGDKDFNSYVVNTVNNTLRAQGRKSLNRITAYGKG